MTGLASIAAILGVISQLKDFGMGIVSTLAATVVNSINVILANLPLIIVFYLFIGTIAAVNYNLSNTSPILMPFEVFARLELNLLTPVTSFDQFLPWNYDVEAILDPSRVAKGTVEAVEAIKNNLTKFGPYMELIASMIFVIGTFLKWGFFVVMNLQILNLVWGWYNVMGVSHT